MNFYEAPFYTKAQLEDFYNKTMANIKDEQVVKLTLYPPKGVKDDIILTKFCVFVNREIDKNLTNFSVLYIYNMYILMNGADCRQKIPGVKRFFVRIQNGRGNLKGRGPPPAVARGYRPYQTSRLAAFHRMTKENRVQITLNLPIQKTQAKY